MATAFLGLSNSPKWFQFNHNKKNNNVNKFNSYYIRPGISTNVNKSNTIGRRHFSITSPQRLVSEELTKFISEKNLNPVFIYEDLSDKTVKSRVLNDTRGLSGIYLILNKVTFDYYIGSASTGRFHARFSNHLFNFHGSKVVKNAVKKHGISSFAFIVLELFPEIVDKENNKKLLDLEDFYLKSLLPNYNILTEAGSSFGYKHNETTRLNMKANYSEERRLAIGSLNKGKSFSPSTIEAMKKSALNRIKPIYSDKSIQNMKKNSKAILVYNMDYTVYGEFPSITEASKSLGCSQKTITRALQTPKKLLRRR
jgi:group I intron endonuclease